MARSRLTRLFCEAALFLCATLAHAHAQELIDVTLAFLKLHRVPCLAVLSVGTVVLDEVVTCDDGREWMLFWLENEVAFVNRETRELYKWG